MNRRNFLRNSLAATAAAAVGHIGCTAEASAHGQPAKRFFFDLRFQDKRENVHTVIAPCIKHPANPLTIDGKTPWCKDNGYFNIWREPETGEFRGQFSDARHDIVGNLGRYWNMRSQDGLRWEKFGHPIFKCAAVMRDDHDTDPARRYKAVFSAHAFRGLNENLNELGVFSACSPDGLVWIEFHPIVLFHTKPGQRQWTPGTPYWAGGDNHPCVLWAPTLGKYVALFRTNIERGEGKRRERAVGRSESADFCTWSSHELVFRGAAEEPGLPGRGRHDIHGIQAWYCGGIYLGIIEPYYWQKDDDRMHMELVWSADTVHWERICPGVDVVPQPDPGDPDGGCRFPACRPLEMGDEVRVYYGSCTMRFLDPEREKRTSSLFLATFRRDRFAGASAGSTPGLIVTRPIPIESRLTLNADAAQGSVRAELRSESGRPVESYSFAESIPITQDALDIPLRWRNRQELPRGPHRIALRLENATLYTINIRSGRD